jgi:hypothetical protein
VKSPTNYLSTYLFDSETKADYTGLPIKTNVATNSLDPNNPNIRWFNYGSGGSTAFVQAPLGTLGNASFFNTYFRNPWLRYENMSVNKEIRIRDSVQMKYSLNVFNIFNRTDFGGINTTLNSSSFGLPTGAQVGARAITMGLRLEF